MCALFQLTLVLTINFGHLHSINAVKRKTYGSIVYPIVVYLVYLAWFYSGSLEDQTKQSYAYFYLPILIMALCDPIATLIGRLYPVFRFRILNNKSIGGLMAFWVGAFILSVIILFPSHAFNTKDLTWVAIFIATVASFTELYSKKGLDNLFIPISVLLAMYVVEYFF